MAIRKYTIYLLALFALAASSQVSSQQAETSTVLDSLNGVDFHTGESVALSDLQGKVIYIDFWASWCKPCREILPALETLHKKHAAQGIAFVAVNIDEVKADAEDFTKQHPISYAHLYDPEGQLAQPFKVRVMPTGVLIDTNGNLHNTHVGFKDGDIEKLESELLSLLK